MKHSRERVLFVYEGGIDVSVRAKFQVISKQESSWGDQTAAYITMMPVFQSMPGVEGNAAEENRIFGQWTPSGKIEMQIMNKDAADQFEQGGYYYVDFTPAY